MFRSLYRVAVAFVLVCTFLLSTIPAQAQPRDTGSDLTLDISWIEAALGWLENFLGGSNGIRTQTTGNNNKICFVDIYQAVPVPIFIVTQPAAATGRKPPQ